YQKSQTRTLLLGGCGGLQTVVALSPDHATSTDRKSPLAKRDRRPTVGELWHARETVPQHRESLLWSHDLHAADGYKPLWHGLRTMPHLPSAGLPLPSGTGDLRSGIGGTVGRPCHNRGSSLCFGPMTSMQ